MYGGIGSRRPTCRRPDGRSVAADEQDSRLRSRPDVGTWADGYPERNHTVVDERRSKHSLSPFFAQSSRFTSTLIRRALLMNATLRLLFVSALLAISSHTLSAQAPDWSQWRDVSPLK